MLATVRGHFEVVTKLHELGANLHVTDGVSSGVEWSGVEWCEVKWNGKVTKLFESCANLHGTGRVRSGVV